MGNAAKNAILRALIEGAITDLMVKTNVSNVYVDDSTTLAAKLSEIITSLNAKATTTALEEGLAERSTTTEMNAAISAAINDLINGAPGTYDTLKEISDYIASHEDVVDTLNAAIGNKADKSTVEAIQTTVNALGALASLDKVSESDLDDALKEKVNAASEGNHSHSNKTVLDGITADNVSAWDSKSRFFVSESQPAELAEGDLWAQLI